MTSDVAVRLAKARQAFQKQADFKKVKTEGLKFAYLPVEAAKPLIEEVTSANGITILPVSYEVVPDFTYYYEKINKYDGTKTKWLYETADVTFSIIGPEDSIELVIRAEAQDNSDKCINKVYTMAYKNLVKIVFGFAESSKDDGDATQVEIPAEAKKVDPKNDPFFGKAKDPAPVNPAPTEVTSDRPRDTMVDTIVKASGDIKLRPAVKKAIDDAGASAIDTDDWSDAQVKAIYNAVVKAGRDAQ